MLVWSSNTVIAAVPRPRQPTLPGPLKSSGVSSSAAVMNPMLSPPGTTALTDRPFHAPPLPPPAAVLLDQVADGDPERDLVGARLVNVAGEVVELGAVATGVTRV